MGWGRFLLGALIVCAAHAMTGGALASSYSAALFGVGVGVGCLVWGVRTPLDRREYDDTPG